MTLASVTTMSDVREDFAAFCERVLGRPLWPHQLEAARAETFITVIAAARRTGKTELAEDLAIWTVFRERNVKVLVLSATEDAARRLVESMNEKLARSLTTRGAVVDDYKSRIKLTNGSEIISLPASQRQVRGYGKGVRLVILDEAGFMPSELWTAAHYTTLDERPNSRILMVGTPWGPAEHFFRRAFNAGNEGDPDHAAHHWTYEANPKLDGAYLERQRDRVSPAEYAAEVRGEWSDATGSLFPRELLDRHVADVELPELAELRPPARGIVGLDWGVSFDTSAAAAIYRLPVAQINADKEWCPRFVVVPKVWPVKTPLAQVVDEAVAARDAFAVVSTETSGVGAMPSQELARRLRGAERETRVNFCATTNAKKTAGYGAILALLERGQLVLPRHPDLLRQLAGLRFEQGERGFTRIEADNPAHHDDVADALFLAAVPYTPKHGRIVCALANIARSQRPDAELHDSSAATVETAAGLQVWRRPPLQGVMTNAVSYPPANPNPTEPVTFGRFRIEGGTA